MYLLSRDPLTGGDPVPIRLVHPRDVRLVLSRTGALSPAGVLTPAGRFRLDHIGPGVAFDADGTIAPELAERIADHLAKSE